MSNTHPTMLSPPIIPPLLQSTALIAPSLYTGFTFAYTHALLPPLLSHAPPKLLARQWLQAYQFAPVYVAPLILLGLASNTLLAIMSPSYNYLYAVAALLNASVIAYTALYMEPGVNGAGKWKVREMLRGEDRVGKKEWVVGRQGTGKDTAREEWKRWAESVDMCVIVECWGRANAVRYVVAGVAVGLSAMATVGGRM